MEILDFIDEIDAFITQIGDMNIIEILILMIGTLFWVCVAVAFLWLCCFMVKSIALYSLAKRTNSKAPWLAFIPILQNAKIFNLAGFTDIAFYAVALVLFLGYCFPIKIFIVLVGFVHLVLAIYIKARVAKNFGGGIVEQILMCLFEPLMLVYFVFTKKTHFPKPINNALAQLLRNCKLEDIALDSRVKTKNVNIEITEDKKD